MWTRSKLGIFKLKFILSPSMSLTEPEPPLTPKRLNMLNGNMQWLKSTML